MLHEFRLTPSLLLLDKHQKANTQRVKNGNLGFHRRHSWIGETERTRCDAAEERLQELLYLWLRLRHQDRSGRQDRRSPRARPMDPRRWNQIEDRPVHHQIRQKCGALCPIGELQTNPRSVYFRFSALGKRISLTTFLLIFLLQNF